MPDRVGQQLGNYRLVKLLGKGGFAEVYLGQHIHLASKQAAIKLLHLIDVDVRKFQEEAETTEKLMHPYIVRLLDFALEEGMPFLVLDYAPGGSLRSRHPQGSIVSLEIVTSYLKEIVPALQYAHELHILHRDIKPDNVLIGRQGELLVSDFGIAVLTQTGRTSLSSTYGVGGTPYYMAPETYQGKPVKESDQYALAIMVYEWLCGTVPFSQGNFIQLGYQHTYNPVPPLRERNPAVSPYVETVILKALSKEPKDRYGSVQLFAQAFEQASMRVLAVENPQLGEGRQGKQMPADQFRQREKEQPSQPSDVQILQSVQKGTGGLGKAPPQSMQSEVTPVGGMELPLETPVMPSQSVVSIVPATSGPMASPSQGVDTRSGAGVSSLAEAALPKAPLSRGPALTPKEEGVTPPNQILLSTDLAASLRPASILPLPRWRELDSEPSPQRRRSYPISTKEREWPRISRRTVITTGVVAAGAVAVGKTFPLISSFFVNSALYTYRGHTEPVSALAWSPDGKYIASGSNDSTVQVWEAITGRQMFINHTSEVTAVAWSPDGKRFASGTGESGGFLDPSPITNVQGASLGSSAMTTQVWDATTGVIVYVHDDQNGPVSAMAWSPNGKYIASANGTTGGSEEFVVQVWDAATGKHVYTYHEHPDPNPPGFPGEVSALAWSANSQRIVTAYWDSSNAVQVWDVATGKHVYTYHGHPDPVHAVAWSPDGKYIASGGSDSTVQVWDATSGKHVYTYHGHPDPVEAVAWSPDGKRIVSGSTDGTAQVWDATTGKNAYIYRGHKDYYWGHLTSSNSVDAVAWSPNGKFIASAGNDKTVQVWRSVGP